MKESKFFPLISRWQEYTQELVQWHSHVDSQNNKETAPYIPIPTTRLLEMNQGKKCYILLGANVSFTLELAKALHATQNPAHILVLEPQQKTAQICLKSFEKSEYQGRISLLYDTSPWALFMLTLSLEPEHCALVFCTPPKDRSQCLQHWRKLFLGSNKKTPPLCTTLPNISLHCIAHPQEPHLESFFAHIPPWIQEVLVLWDAENFSKNLSCPAPLKQFSHPLQGDFSAQRNRLLAKSSARAVLYLDADERLDISTWEAIKNFDTTTYEGGIVFPRLTFEGDDQHVRIGHGLWPDVQLRLFPLNPQVRFVNTVHEKLEGLTTPPTFAPNLPIWHYSHIHKSAEELKQRLETFNKSGSFTHTLSDNYPCLPKNFFELWKQNKKHIYTLPI